MYVFCFVLSSRPSLVHFRFLFPSSHRTLDSTLNRDPSWEDEFIGFCGRPLSLRLGMMNSNTQEGEGGADTPSPRCGGGGGENEAREAWERRAAAAPLHACSNITYVVTCFLHAVRPAGHHSCSLEPSYLKLNISKLVVDGKLE